MMKINYVYCVSCLAIRPKFTKVSTECVIKSRKCKQLKRLVGDYSSSSSYCYAQGMLLILQNLIALLLYYIYAYRRVPTRTLFGKGTYWRALFFVVQRRAWPKWSNSRPMPYLYKHKKRWWWRRTW